MALSIKDAKIDQLARDLAHVTGESLTVAIGTAVRERLERVSGLVSGQDLAAELTTIALRCAAMPVLDDRSAEAILGYDAHGLPA